MSVTTSKFEALLPDEMHFYISDFLTMQGKSILSSLSKKFVRIRKPFIKNLAAEVLKTVMKMKTCPEQKDLFNRTFSIIQEKVLSSSINCRIFIQRCNKKNIIYANYYGISILMEKSIYPKPDRVINCFIKWTDPEGLLKDFDSLFTKEEAQIVRAFEDLHNGPCFCQVVD